MSLRSLYVVFTLMIIAGWYCKLLDVNGAFLLGTDFLAHGNDLYMDVPQGFE